MRHFKFLALACALLLGCAFAQQNPSQSQANAAIATPASTAAATQGTAVENDADPLLDLPPLPKDKISLIGGKVTGLDRVRNKITVEAFGGKKMKLAFDERTHIYRDGVETTQLGIRKGDRVYVDTQLVGSTVFARNIRVENKMGPADAQGQIVSYDAGRGTMVLKDSLSSEPIRFRVMPNTVVSGKSSSLSQLREGALVNVSFAPDSGTSGLAQQITVTALPGETFTFTGRVMHLDMRSGTMAVQNQTDGKTYEIRFDSARADLENLVVGSIVTVNAEFDGKTYTAQNVEVKQAKSAEK
jgi:hypothetical protein